MVMEAVIERLPPQGRCAWFRINKHSATYINYFYDSQSSDLMDSLLLQPGNCQACSSWMIHAPARG